ncbi:MAG TPA: glycosyltransferase family 4 protein [Vicinamibacterales bacterium]|nr:glycosyltransferase family 4 protein [Vicinamibacterales bacterium]
MSGPIRVLRLIARLNVGGPARHVVLLDAGLRRRGCETLLLHGDVADGEASLEHLAATAGVPAMRIAGLGRRISVLGDVRALIGIARALIRFRPDIVHTHTAKAGVLGRAAAGLYNLTRRRSRRCLIVHTFHGNVLAGYFGAVGSGLVRVAERAMARLTDRVIVIAEQQRREIVDRFRVAPAQKVAVVPLGLDLAQLLALGPDGPSLRGTLGFAAEDVVFGYVGRFVAIKDLDTMLRAFAAALPRAPRARLMMVGDGELRAHIEQLARDLRVPDAVRFTGWRHDLPAVYATMDVGILSSRNEGTPVSLIEAMAAARPVLATDVGGVRDLVDPGLTGLLVPAGNVSQLADGIVRLTAPPSDRRRMGQTARAHVAVRFTAARLVDDIERVYTEGLRMKRRMPGASAQHTMRPVA